MKYYKSGYMDLICQIILLVVFFMALFLTEGIWFIADIILLVLAAGMLGNTVGYIVSERKKKTMVINKEKIYKIIYYNLIPIIIGAILFTYLGSVESISDFVQKLIIFAIIIIPFSIIYVWLGDKFLFPDKTAHVYKILYKMVNCELRKEKGDIYCTQCPEGYECASSEKLKKLENEEKNDGLM